VTPSNPQDPQKGKVADEVGRTEAEAQETQAQVPAEEAATEAQEAPRRRRARRKAAEPEAEETAAAETGVEKGAAEAAKPKPRKAPAKAPEEVAGTPAREAGAQRRPRRGGRAQDGDGAGPDGVVVRAQARYVRTSARKARLVCEHIRGKDVAEARAILAFTPRAAAEAWTKLLDSAVANAEHNHELDGEELRIHRVYADEGPTLKRFRPRAMGRATRIRKRTSHLTIELTPKEL
jgi:ribosomal protein L22